MGKTFIEDRICENKNYEKIRQFLENGFRESGFEIEFTPDFKKHQWNKLFVNSVINPITALTGQENGIVLSDQMSLTVRSVVREAVSCCPKRGPGGG